MLSSWAAGGFPDQSSSIKATTPSRQFPCRSSSLVGGDPAGLASAEGVKCCLVHPEVGVAGKDPWGSAFGELNLGPASVMGKKNVPEASAALFAAK